ncbi:FtsX-like permease family protein [Candidatus Poribacteria bacterium]|nr:FtsX-like permease family protein [Candidatus Poribacteria bacterium]
MRYIFKMAFRNIGRNKRRTMLSAIAISIAIMVILVMRGYIGGIIDSMFDSLTKVESGHIKISHNKYYEKQDMMPLEHMIDGFDGGGYQELLPVLKSVEDVEIVAPRIKFGVLLSHSGKNSSALGIGVEPEAEDRLISFDNKMVDGGYLSTGSNSNREIIMGKGLASKLGLKTGEKITILARTAYDSLRGMTFTVSGTFSFGISAIDDKLFYIPIGFAQRLLEMGQNASEIIIMVNKPENAEEISEKIKSQIDSKMDDPYYAVVPWNKQEGMLSMFSVATNIYSFIYLFLLVLASTVIINTTMMVIYERMKEIGTIGALGMSSGQIILLFVVEAMLISVIGSFIGMVVGGGIDFILSEVGINLQKLSGGSVDFMTTDIIYPRFDFSILIGSFIFGVVVATVVSYFPSRRAAKIEPVEALRSV